MAYMAKKEQWITGKQAAAILTEQSGHEISQDYVRLLAKKGKIRSQPIDGRTNGYHEGDVKAYRVKLKTGKREAAAPTKEQEAEEGWWKPG
jgi:ribosomal protein S3AE